MILQATFTYFIILISALSYSKMMQSNDFVKYKIYG